MGESQGDGGGNDRQKLCFVIGPMRTAAQRQRQARLASDILGPLLTPNGYHVRTPDEPKVGEVIHHVLANLDQAELVVADLTNNNPSVMYELAVRHCVGLPYIMVAHQSSRRAKVSEPLAFDVRHYRYCGLDLDHPEAARQTLAPMIETTLTEIAKNELQSNPVTEYYNKTPLVESSPGAGLALGYFLNFVRRTAIAILDSQAQIVISDSQRPAPGQPKEQLNREQIGQLRLEMYLPSNLYEASPDYVDTLVNNLKASGFEMRYADIDAPGRRVGVRVHQNALVDIPTTMSAMREAIRPRGSETAVRLDTPEAQFLLRREFERFRAALDRWIHGGDDPDPKVSAFLKDRVTVRTVGELASYAKGK